MRYQATPNEGDPRTVTADSHLGAAEIVAKRINGTNEPLVARRIDGEPQKDGTFEVLQFFPLRTSGLTLYIAQETNQP